jgi:hypothetical protein
VSWVSTLVRPNAKEGLGPNQVSTASPSVFAFWCLTCARPSSLGFFGLFGPLVVRRASPFVRTVRRPLEKAQVRRTVGTQGGALGGLGYWPFSLPWTVSFVSFAAARSNPRRPCCGSCRKEVSRQTERGGDVRVTSALPDTQHHHGLHRGSSLKRKVAVTKERLRVVGRTHALCALSQVCPPTVRCCVFRPHGPRRTGKKKAAEGTMVAEATQSVKHRSGRQRRY